MIRPRWKRMWNPWEWLKWFYEAVGHKHPLMSACAIILVSALVGFLIWWRLDAQYKKDHPIPDGAATPSQSQPSEGTTDHENARLRISITTVGENYPEGLILGGIKWKPEYLDARLRLFNGSNADFSNVDLIFAVSEIVRIALFRHYPDAGVIPIGFANTSVFLNGVAQPSEQITTSPCRIHCAKIVSNSMVEFIMAVTHRKEPKNFHILQGSYEVGGQKLLITVKDVFAA